MHPERQAELAADLRGRRDRGAIDEEDYEQRMSELEQSVRDLVRERDLEKEAPPGEDEDAPLSLG